MNKIINIAIDGPSGAGKSTISKEIAKRLSFIYIDTGALYRAIALFALQQNVIPSSEDEVVPLLEKINLEMKFINNEQKIFLNDNDVSIDIRKNEVSMAASNISALPPVRAFLLKIQRDIAKKNSCIMDGRDIGTVILPDAQIKIFLTATPNDRAQRRHIELKSRNEIVDFDTLLEEIKTRDYNDSNREIAPLKPSKTSIIIDTTNNSLEESINTVYKIIRGKLDVI